MKLKQLQAENEKLVENYRKMKDEKPDNIDIQTDSVCVAKYC